MRTRQSIVVTANTDKGAMVIYSTAARTLGVPTIILPKETNPFLAWLKTNFPLLDWQLDDGVDDCRTEYVQYAAYPSNDDEYILARFQIDRE